jgi:Tfp pilus assembly protein PilN
MIERIEINLLPVEYRVRKRSFNLPRSIVYPALALIVFAVGAGFYTIYLGEKQARLTDEIEAIEKEIAANKQVQTEINELRKRKQITDQKIRALERISVDREKWVRLLEVFSGNLPTYAWLISVKESGEEQPRNIVVEARTYSFPEVADYMKKLEAAEYIKNVTLMPPGIEQIQGSDRKVYKFTITCDINPDVGLRPALNIDEHIKEESAAKESASAGKRRGRARADDGGKK